MKKTAAALLLLALLAGCIPATPGEWLTPSPTTPSQAPTSVTAHPSPAGLEELQAALEQPTATATAQPACRVWTGIPTGTVNVRLGPGMDYPVIDVVHEGEILTLYGQPEQGWQKVGTPRQRAGWFFIAAWCEFITIGANE